MMRWLTHLGGARVTIGVGLVLMAAGALRLGLATLIANVMSHLAVQVLKRTVRRPRPCDANGQALALVELPDPFSFPSGHAAASTAVAATLCLHEPLLVPLLLPVAAAVGASRVWLRVHYLGDVLAGVILGLGGALTAAILL